MRILRYFGALVVIAAICGALSCPRAVQAQNPGAKNGQGQNGSPVPGVSRTVWEHLNTELDKGKDPDDPGKMLRYWLQTTGGTLSETQRQELVRLANRMASRRSLGADTEVYTTMLAALMLKFDERWQKDAWYKSETEKKILGLQAQNSALAEQINTLKAQADAHAADADKNTAALQNQLRDLRNQLESLKQQIPAKPASPKPTKK